MVQDLAETLLGAFGVAREAKKSLGKTITKNVFHRAKHKIKMVTLTPEDVDFRFFYKHPRN